MHQRILLFIGLLLILLTIIIIVTKNKKKPNSSKVSSSSQKFGLSSSTGSSSFPPDNKEAIKMTLPLVLKNTIMSLKPLVLIDENLDIKPEDVINKRLNPSDFGMYGSGIDNNTSTIPVKEIEYNPNNKYVYFIIQDGEYNKMLAYDVTLQKVAGIYTKGINETEYRDSTNSTIYKLKRILINPDDVINKRLNPSDFEMYGSGIANNTSTITVKEILYKDSRRYGYVYFIIQDGEYNKMLVYHVQSQTGAGNYIKGINETSYRDSASTDYKVKKIINSSNLYPSVIREGLFYIKMKGTNKYIWKNNFGGLELKDTAPNFEEFSSKYQSGILENGKEQPMPFFLKFKEKDENNREYTFYIKSFLGDIGSEDSFKNIGIKPFWQAGYNNLTARFNYHCGSYRSDDGGFDMNIPVGQKELHYDTNNFTYDNEISWFYMPAGLKGFGYWDKYADPIGPNTSSSLCKTEMDGRWESLLIKYEYPDLSSLSIMDIETDDSSCEFKFIYDENNNLYIKQGDKYLRFWYDQFPLVDAYQNIDAIELVPVLDSGDGKLASRYYKASMEFLSKEDGKTALSKFCDYNGDMFKDGTRKIYDNATNSISEDIIEKAFGSICDCNMSQNFYTERICPTELIVSKYGLNRSSETIATFDKKLNILRSTLQCLYPNCSAAKCVKWGTLKAEGKPNYDYIEARRDKGQCGSTTLCITNQNLSLGAGAVLQGNVLNFDTSTECGGSGGTQITPVFEETGDFITDGKVLKRNIICKINNNVVTPADNPECKSDITYMKFEGSACKIITDSQTGKKIIVKNISSQKTDNINWDDIKVNQLDFIKTNINSIPNCS